MANKKIYKSAKGKTVDLDKLKVMNEKTIAVGKRVNARGDLLGKGDEIIMTRAERNKERYAEPTAVNPNKKG